MSSLTHIPHDSFFREFLFWGRGRDFLDIYLPAHLKQVCDLSTIRPEPDSFVDDKLKRSACDMLYSVQLEGYLYTLIEHVSKSEPITAFTVHRYMVAAMHHYIKLRRENSRHSP